MHVTLHQPQSLDPAPSGTLYIADTTPCHGNARRVGLPGAQMESSGYMAWESVAAQKDSRDEGA